VRLRDLLALLGVARSRELPAPQHGRLWQPRGVVRVAQPLLAGRSLAGGTVARWAPGACPIRSHGLGGPERDEYYVSGPSAEAVVDAYLAAIRRIP